jgi:hypothetical protein
MAREISNLDLKIKLTLEYIENGGYKDIYDVELLKDLIKVKKLPNGKADPETITPKVNTFMMALLSAHLRPAIHHPNYIVEYISTLQKSHSFQQENIDTIEQFDKVYDKYNVTDNVIFRGQREAKWRLYSKLQRFWLNDKLFEKELSYQLILENIIEEGRDKYKDHINFYFDVKNIDTLNSISTLGFLQHHGCPTPLLDWTYSFQNALYFAIDGLEQNEGTVEIENYCSVYFLEEEYMKEGNFSHYLEDILQTLEEEELLRMIKIIAGDDLEKEERNEVTL